jgi:phage-related minor tail protein
MIDNFDSTDNSFLPETVDKVRDSTRMLGVSTTVFAKAISKAFTDAAAGGKQFDDVLKQLALRLSGMAVTQAVNPVAKGLAGGLSKLFDGLFAGGGDSSESRRAIPFATGGVIGAPTYFPLSQGGLGLAGEAGPEAIIPLTRGSDGRLGVAMSAGQPTNVTVHIATADAQSFRRSEAYVTGQIARAVARGQRGF